MPVPTPLLDPREGQERHGLVTPALIAATVVSAAWRAAAAALSGLLLVGGVALVLWAVTPGSGADATAVLRGGVVAYAAAHFLPVAIGAIPVTIHPLLLTVVAVAVIASAAGRAQPVRGRTLEALHGCVFSVGYAVAVDVVVVVAAPPGAAQAGLLAPLCIAFAGSVLGLATHRTAWRRWWRRWAPVWISAAVRASALAVCLLLAAGAIAVAVGLAASLSDATAVTRLAAGSTGGELGLFLLGLAFLPNAVIAGVGYVSGAGFSLGAGTYSPLLVHTADLPAIPLLAAAPGRATGASLLALAAPLAAGVLIGVLVCRLVSTRRDRLIAAALAAVTTGGAVAVLAAAAGGGVAGGPWAVTGADPLLSGGVVALALALVAGAWTGVAGLGTVAWAPSREVGDRPRTVGEPASDGETGGDETDGDETAGDEVAGDEVAGDEGSGDETAGDETAGDETAGDEVAGDEGSGDETDGDETAGDESSGDQVDGETSRGDQDETPRGSCPESAVDPFDPADAGTDAAADDTAFPDHRFPDDRDASPADAAQDDDQAGPDRLPDAG